MDGYFVCPFCFTFLVFLYFLVVCEVSLVSQVGTRNEKNFPSIRETKMRERDIRSSFQTGLLGFSFGQKGTVALRCSSQCDDRQLSYKLMLTST